MPIPKYNSTTSTFYTYNSSGNLTMNTLGITPKNVPLETAECCPAGNCDNIYVAGNKEPIVSSINACNNKTKNGNATSRYAPLGTADIKASVTNTNISVSFITIPNESESLKNTTSVEKIHTYSNEPKPIIFRIAGSLIFLFGVFVISASLVDWYVRDESKYYNCEKDPPEKTDDQLIYGQLKSASERKSCIESRIKKLERKKMDFILPQQQNPE